MASFGYSKHKKKNLEFANNIFEFKVYFWVKIHFDPIVRWRGLDKINVHIIYNLQFFLVIIRLH
jgi:hypothetical protein